MNTSEKKSDGEANKKDKINNLQNVQVKVEAMSNQKSMPKLTRVEKRAIIQELLRTNFPFKSVLFFGMSFVLIGLAAVTLQIILIANQSPGSNIAGGIWGGFFAFLNGLHRLILCKKILYILMCLVLSIL